MKMPNVKAFFLLVFFLFAGAANGQEYFIESFDGATFPPTGWTQSQLSGTGLWERQTSGSNPTCLPQSGSGMIRYNSFSYAEGTSAVLISSRIDLTDLSGLKLQFWMYRDAGRTTYLDAVDAYINTTNTLSGAHYLGTVNRPTTATPVVAEVGWHKFSFSIPSSFDGENNYILLKATSQYGNNIFVDHISIILPVPADNPPANFSASDITKTSMTISWVDNSTNEEGFRVYASTDGENYTKYGNDVISTTQTETGEIYSIGIENLLPGTTYYFRISAFLDTESEYLTGTQSTSPPDQITSTKTGNWSDPTSWSSGQVPSSVDDIIIDSDHIITLDENGFSNKISVNGTLSLQAFTLTVGEIDISSTGAIIVESGSTANISVSRNITNNGLIDLYLSDVINGRITFTGTVNQTLFAEGTTNLGNITVNKGSSHSNVAEVIANGTFSIKSGATTNFLTLTNGTFKVSGTATISSNVFQSGGYIIGSTSGFWLNNPNFIVLAQGSSAVNNGLFRLSAGSYNIGQFSDNSFGGGTGSVFTIEGGVLNIAGRFSTDNAVTLNVMGGEINVNTVGNSSTSASFGFTSSQNSINISGGSINLVRRNTNANPLDYNVLGENINITGGVLNVGKSTTPSPFDFRIRGNTPSIVIDNTTNPKSVLLNAATNVYGNITLNSGTTLNAQTFTVQIIGNPSQTGNIINNGLITNTSATGSNLITFIGQHGSQSVSGTGTIGNSTTPFAGISVLNPEGIILSASVVTNRINLFTGQILGTNNITLGNGAGSSPVVQRGGNSSLVAGSFDQLPTISSGSAYKVIYSTALSPFSTGYELPSVSSSTIELASNVDITLGNPVSAGKLSFAASNTGMLITTETNLLTISGTLPSDLTMVTGNTGYVYGPFARTLPSSLATGSTYIFPVGKGSLNLLELVNPITNAGGSVIVKAEVFDEPTGGTAGNNIIDGSLGNRYWVAHIVSGEDNFTNTYVRVTQETPAFTTEHGLAKSSTLTGTYDLVSTEQPVNNTIKSDAITELGYFVIGEKQVSQVYLSSTTTQPATTIVMRGESNQLIIGVEIVTSGNNPSLQANSFEFNTNGTTLSSDILNAKLYYTGNNPTFTTETQVGGVVSSPSGTYNINPNQNLLEGTNFFWLVYDISDNATDKNIVDAECTSITIGDTPCSPSITSPEGTRTIRARLSGTYLVGIDGNYSTITDAVNDLNLVGVYSSVVFSLTDESYSTEETFPITVNPIMNSSTENSVCIKPAFGILAQIVGNSTSSIFTINSSNFIIDGSNTHEGITRDLTIINNGTGANSSTILSTNVSNIAVKNIISIGGINTSGFGIVLDGINDALIYNNKISKVHTAIQLKGNSNQILIEKSDIGANVTNDKVGVNGIIVQNSNNFDIRYNTIIGITTSSTSTASGISITGTSSNGNIFANNIRDIKNTRSTGYGSNGIWLNSSITANQILVFNNIISDVASAGFGAWGTGDNGYGIVISSGGGYKIYYNTIHLNTDQSSVGGGNTAGINITSAITTANSLNIRNNIIISTQTKGTRYAVYCAAPNTVFADINYNNYRAPTGVGFIGGSARTTLANWQTGTQKDANSLNVLPFFTSATDLSLVNNKNCPLDGAGTPIAGITTDFDGVTRDASFPDMGAIEFTTIPFAAPVAEFEEVCYGENSGLLTLTEYEGTITGWESSSSPFGEWSSIVNTMNTYTSEPLYENTRFRTLVNNGLCTNFATEYVEVAVSPETVGGSVTGGTAICTGQTSGLLTLTDHVGDVVRWESAVSPFDTWTPIVNTLTTYTSNTLTETTRFRAVVKSGVCDEQPSDYTEVVVFPVSEGGTVSGGTTICSGETSSELSLSGNVGDVVRWEYSVNETDWFEIANNEITYTSGALTETTHFRAVVQSGPCSEAASEFTTVTVDPPSAGGAVTGGTSICSGQTSGVLTLSGHTGDVVRWESSISPFDTWSPIVNTLTTYTSGAITEVTRFRAVVKSGVCSEATSNYTEVTISPPTVGGNVTGGTSICEGETSGLLTLSGHTGDIIKWQSSINTTDWTDIANTTTTYTSGILTQTTHFRAVVKSGGCDALESAYTTVTVNPLPDAVIGTTNALSFCEGDDISVTFTATPAGGTYRWFKNDVAISGATSATFIATSAGSYSVEVTVNGCSDISEAKVITVNPLPNAVIATTDPLTYCEADNISVTFTATPAGGTYHWFKNDVAISGANSAIFTATSAGSYSAEVIVNGCSDISEAKVITVNPLPNAVIATTDPLTYCEADNISVTFTATPAGGTYRWFKNDVVISGATTATYTATSAGNYSAEVTVNGCSGYSNELEILVNPTPIPVVSTVDNLNYCFGDEISVEFTVDISAEAYQWFKNESPIDGETDPTYKATEEGFYSVGVMVNGCPGISNEIEIVVNPLPISSLPSDTVFLPNYESYLFDAGEGFASYLWFDESTEQTYLFDGSEWGTGIYDVWVEVTNEFGCTTRDSVVVNVGHVGITTMASFSANIFPNPNSGRFTISTNGVTSKHLRVSIFNIMGQIVYNKDFRVNASHFTEIITLNEKAKGIYFISISDGKEIITKRIVIE